MHAYYTQIYMYVSIYIAYVHKYIHTMYVYTRSIFIRALYNCLVSANNDVWLDSSLYEIFIYRKLNQNKILKNISLIVTFSFWNNVSNSSEDFCNNITFNLSSSAHFTLDFDTFERFQNENTPQIVRRSSIISSLALDLMLGDYNMKIQAVWQDMKLAESEVIIHVVDPVPAPLPPPGFYNML